MYRVFSSILAKEATSFLNVRKISSKTRLSASRTADGGASIAAFARECENLVQYSDEVLDAKRRGLPIVALESTIITHGMPYPENLATATRVEEIIRETGVVPATIAILGGKIQIGMDRDRLERLAKSAEDNGERATKCSRRDISRIVSENVSGGTTVSGTMTIARIAEIPIMATGGIGGVHRGAEFNFDVSSDLTELGRSRVAVVCAGVKAILDIPKTLEYLETQGVPVITIADGDNFPAFYCRETSPENPVKSPSRVSDVHQAAKLVKIQETLGLENGILFAVPIPESDALDSSLVESTIREALQIAEMNGIRGKDVTPYLLRQLNRLTSGGFLKANQALVENNARVAAEMALSLSSLRRNDGGSNGSRGQQPCEGAPVVIGGATVDTVLHVELDNIELDGRTHRAKSRQSHGGVGRNVAAAMIALGLENTRLVTAVGNDSAGRSILRDFTDAGETIEILPNAVTPSYTAILDKRGECRFGVGEMDTFEAIDTNLLIKHRAAVERAGVLVLDGNLPLGTMRASLDIAARNRIPVWYEPTDVSKAAKIFEAAHGLINFNVESSEDSVIQFISPNINELVAVARHLRLDFLSKENLECFDKDNLCIEWISELSRELAKIVPVVVTTLGSRGIIIAKRGSTSSEPLMKARKRVRTNNVPSNEIKSRWYPAPIIKRQTDEEFSVSGCGDCLTAAIITGSYRGLGEADCVKFALEAAVVSLKSSEPVPRALRDLRKFFTTSDY